jgi:sigma-B regulation protein RsbU (phosphoserine phosphatase)
VRAGHDPALVYHPESDTFDKLEGQGLALGVDGEWTYQDNETFSISKGNILFLSTDGVWEVRNDEGEMLGKQPILTTIRENASSNSTQIIDAIFNSLNEFAGKTKIEDDITLVVIKVMS